MTSGPLQKQAKRRPPSYYRRQLARSTQRIAELYAREGLIADIPSEKRDVTHERLLISALEKRVSDKDAFISELLRTQSELKSRVKKLVKRTDTLHSRLKSAQAFRLANPVSANPVVGKSRRRLNPAQSAAGLAPLGPSPPFRLPSRKLPSASFYTRCRTHERIDCNDQVCVNRRNGY